MPEENVPYSEELTRIVVNYLALSASWEQRELGPCVENRRKVDVRTDKERIQLLDLWISRRVLVRSSNWKSTGLQTFATFRDGLKNGILAR